MPAIASSDWQLLEVTRDQIHAEGLVIPELWQLQRWSVVAAALPAAGGGR